MNVCGLCPEWEQNRGCVVLGREYDYIARDRCTMSGWTGGPEEGWWVSILVGVRVDTC